MVIGSLPGCFIDAVTTKPNTSAACAPTFTSLLFLFSHPPCIHPTAPPFLPGQLGHEALEALAAEVDSLERSLAEAEEGLKMYDSIPPSAAGLAAMLERSHRELEDMRTAMGSAFVHGSSAASTRLSGGGLGMGLGGPRGGMAAGAGGFGFGNRGA
jgi:hypothetical protein